MSTSSSTTSKWLVRATKILSDAGLDTARLDCLVLLSDALKVDKSSLIAHPEQLITSETLAVLNHQLKRRANHEPLSYIIGKSEFYGREFTINKHTLQPRPETETMIDLLKQISNSQNPPLLKDGPFTETENVNCVVIDVGSGSGAIGVTVGAEFPDWEIIGTDLSPECIDIAEQNASNLGVKARFYIGNLLEPVDNFDFGNKNLIILTNLPYVPNNHKINSAAEFEPKMAIFGGDDGLDLYRKFFEQLTEYSLKPFVIFTESLPEQHKELSKIALLNGYNINYQKDFIQIFELTK